MEPNLPRFGDFRCRHRGLSPLLLFVFAAAHLEAGPLLLSVFAAALIHQACRGSNLEDLFDFSHLCQILKQCLP